MFTRKHSLGFLIALCFASLLNSLALAQRPTVKELSDGVDRRHATYRDLKFISSADLTGRSSRDRHVVRLLGSIRRCLRLVVLLEHQVL
jgi:hypothetical protein